MPAILQSRIGVVVGGKLRFAETSCKVGGKAAPAGRINSPSITNQPSLVLTIFSHLKSRWTHPLVAPNVLFPCISSRKVKTHRMEFRNSPAFLGVLIGKLIPKGFNVKVNTSLSVLFLFFSTLHFVAYSKNRIERLEEDDMFV